MIDARNHLPRRTGLTLLELLIVVVILALAAGLTVPIVQRSFTSQRVDKAASLVRAGLNRARVSSMRTGEIYGFYYSPESRDFRVAPFNRETLDLLQSQRRSVVDAGSNFDFGDDRLPQGILFLDGETIKDSRSEQALSDGSGSTRDIKPVLFYPDGSSQTAKIMLRCDNEYAEVHLRGMTGTSTIVPVDESRLPRN